MSLRQLRAWTCGKRSLSSSILRSHGSFAVSCNSRITSSKKSPLEYAAKMLVIIAGSPADRLVKAAACCCIHNNVSCSKIRFTTTRQEFLTLYHILGKFSTSGLTEDLHLMQHAVNVCATVEKAPRCLNSASCVKQRSPTCLIYPSLRLSM